MFRVSYAAKTRLGLLQSKTPIRKWGQLKCRISGRFFAKAFEELARDAVIEAADQILSGTFLYFNRHRVRSFFPPEWFANPFSDSQETSPDVHWSRIPDFSEGDIKGVWEVGRFDWVYPLIGAYHQTGDQKYAEAFWMLAEDWADKNPPNAGVHWKCGQEIAIRMFALASGCFAFADSSASTEKRHNLAAEIIYRSAERIEANIDYALSQRNNHGVSEAAGLFTAGLLVNEKRWVQKGKGLLEDLAQDLIYEDGSFSQHSANYHRLMLHDYLWAAQLGRANGVEFSAKTMDRVQSAGHWLRSLYDSASGRMPNLGGNDGALLFPVADCGYIDYRPTIQAVGAVVEGKQWIEAGPWDGLARFLVPGFESETRSLEPDSCNLGKWRFEYLAVGGYAVFSSGQSKAIFHCPRKFRHGPPHCDILHVDLWHKGLNLLRDGGTYSYNCEQPWLEYFKSTAAHNTIQFDGHNQMPQLSRFLFGRWPELDVRVEGSAGATAGFRDWKGCRHHRSVKADRARIVVTDTIGGFKNRAVLRWRLAPEVNWEPTESGCQSELMEIRVEANDGLLEMKVVQGWESLYYMEKTPLPVLELTLDANCRLVQTLIELK